MPKEYATTAQSDKWMWVTWGGPTAQLCVLFEYGPSHAGLIPEQLLHGFSGTLQADPVCPSSPIMLAKKF